MQTAFAILVGQKSDQCDAQNVTSLIINPQDMGAGRSQSLTTTRKRYQRLRSKFHSRPQVFNKAQEKILKKLDDKEQPQGGKSDRSFLGLEEQSEADVEIAETMESENIFSTFMNGFHFNFGASNEKKKDKKNKEKKAK